MDDYDAILMDSAMTNDVEEESYHVHHKKKHRKHSEDGDSEKSKKHSEKRKKKSKKDDKKSEKKKKKEHKRSKNKELDQIDEEESFPRLNHSFEEDAFERKCSRSSEFIVVCWSCSTFYWGTKLS